MVDHMWQSTLFALGAGALTLAFRNNRAQIRYCLWFIASLKFLIPFHVLISVGSFFGRGTMVPVSPTRLPVIVGHLSALQDQFGLRLQSAKGPVEVVVIDDARKPMEN